MVTQPQTGPAAQAAEKTRMQRILDTVERVGNRVPHPVMIFVYLIILVVVVSHILSMFGAQVSYTVWNTETGDYEQRTTAARSLLTVDGIRFMYTGVVANFMAFNAVGVIIVAMVGVGVAEGSLGEGDGLSVPAAAGEARSPRSADGLAVSEQAAVSSATTTPIGTPTRPATVRTFRE